MYVDTMKFGCRHVYINKPPVRSRNTKSTVPLLWSAPLCLTDRAYFDTIKS